MDRKQYIKELRWTPQVSEGFLYIDLILHRQVHLIMHTLISISAHIHMKHKKWYVTCVGAKDIYIYVYMSVIWHLPLVRVQKFINIAIFFCYNYSNFCQFTDSFIKFMLSFFLYIFFFCITRTFHKCQNWGSAKWFFSTSNFLFGGMYLSNIHWHLKPIQIFPGVWRNMGQLYFMWFWRIFFWINSCSNTYEKCQIDKFVFVAFSGKDNWMGCKSRHFSASEILSITYFQKR